MIQTNRKFGDWLFGFGNCFGLVRDGRFARYSDLGFIINYYASFDHSSFSSRHRLP